MPPRDSWSSLLPGLISLAVVLSIAAGVVVFGGIGRMRGETIRLYVLANQAHGLMSGSEVWLAGQKVGVVDKVEFLAPGADADSRVVIVVKVKAQDAAQIRRDSHAQVRSGGTVIAPKVVYVTPGTPASPQVAEGDTLRAAPQSDIGNTGERLKAAAEQLGPLMTDARTVMASVHDPSGTVGAALAGGGGGGGGTGDVARLRANVARLRNRLSGSAAGPGLETVLEQSRAALARADSVRALLASSGTSYGRFRRDTTLGATVANLRDELAELRARLDATDGTVGRFAGDSAIPRAVAAAQREMTLLSDDIRRRPLRYLAF